ncbi:hypothetical protein [Bordetella sp. 2513F-2]
MKRINESTWNHLLMRLKQARQRDANHLDALIAARQAEHRLLGGTPRYARLNEQRDALGLALDIGHLDRRSVLESIAPEKAPEAQSMLDLLDDSIRPQERSLLEHDGMLFELLLDKAPHRSITISNDRGYSVSVKITDHTNLEAVLGTDLLIYNARFNSFLLLQYKKMAKVQSTWSYAIPPSANLRLQLRRMLTLQSAINRQVTNSSSRPQSLWNYRLNNDPCYFKFCEEFRPNARDASLVPGITIPAAQLDAFLDLPEARGQNGGLSVGYNNCPRYLNNTEFIDLARSGWIGGGEHCFELMQSILKANAQGDHATVVAILDGPQHTSASERRWWT